MFSRTGMLIHLSTKLFNWPKWSHCAKSSLSFPSSFTHIFIGPVELRAHLQYYDHKQTVLSVDLNSFHKEQVTRTACRQSSTDIAERNLFELVIMVGLRTGNISTVKSKPFRIGIKSQQMVKDIEQDNSGK